MFSDISMHEIFRLCMHAMFTVTLVCMHAMFGDISMYACNV